MWVLSWGFSLVSPAGHDVEGVTVTHHAHTRQLVANLK